MYSDCEFIGPILTPQFVTTALPAFVARHGPDPAELQPRWQTVWQGQQDFAGTGGPVRVMHHIVAPLADALAYGEIRPAEPASTREGLEDGGYFLKAAGGGSLRVWPIASSVELDTISRRGTAARTSPMRRAIRVLRASGECCGIVTNGMALRLLFCDPSGPDSHIDVSLTGRAGWSDRRIAPESFHLVCALASPSGTQALSEIFDAARMHQSAVTKTLRAQARAAIEDFLQCVLDRNRGAASLPAPGTLWRQALTIVYRLLFILKLESSVKPGGGFSFAASKSWRHGFSPNRALGPLVRRHLDLGHSTGRMLEDGLRALFKVCGEGLAHAALSIAPLGGGLFDPDASEHLDALDWGEHAVALLLDRLLWTASRGRERERVYYGSLDVEELGRIYEALLDLEPELAAEPMVRLRRGRSEAVIPASSARGTVLETIPIGRFFLRTGLGRRTGGSYYTPHEFVAYLVREALTPLLAPALESVDPRALLRLKVFDPAMGSGHFLVAACRFLADALYEICCRLDGSGTKEARRIIDQLPDPDHRLASNLPSRTQDLSAVGPSSTRALAICRRMIAVHCLYGTDIDPLAVELAKLSIWSESFAEGLPLTFLDHRLIAGDSVSGPFFSDLSFLPIGGGQLDPLLAFGVTERLRERISHAMAQVQRLEASIGTSISDTMVKQAAKDKLDELLSPLRRLAESWSGAVKADSRDANDVWMSLARSVAATGTLPKNLNRRQVELLKRGGAALSLDLTFPEVFRPDGGAGGFDAVLGNPPWDVIHYQTKEYLARYDPSVMEAPTKREREAIEQFLLADPKIRDGFRQYKDLFVERKRMSDRLFAKSRSTGSIDTFQIFAERMLNCVARGGSIGIVVPSSFHANEGTAHIRKRYLNEVALAGCFTFENRKKFFDIHSRQKFTLLVGRRNGATAAFRCAFYLEAISQTTAPDRVMVYDRDFISASGGGAETFLELRGREDLRVARNIFVGHPRMRDWMLSHHIRFGREAHMTDDARRFVPIKQIPAGEVFPLHEGKTFHQYTDRWKSGPRYAIPVDGLTDKPDWLRASGHYRLAFREISRSTDERTMIAAIIPPGNVFGHKGTCEKAPWQRPDAEALVLCAIFNSFAFDWCVRRKIAASVSLFMLNDCPAPELSSKAAAFVAHGALRLSYRHDGFEQLWRNQLKIPPEEADLATRMILRAAIDAVVAHGYELARDDYRHILTDFSHKKNPAAPAQCLAAYDLISDHGADAFYRAHDPFVDIPLADRLSQSNIERPTASAILIPSTPAERIPPA